MIQTSDLINTLKKNKINFFSGVPDSVLKNLSIYLQNKKKHILAVNEGAAVSIGIGHYLSTKEIPCIYLQNSGLSNAINPLISIAHKNVYSIPMVLLIGWRGSPGSKDEPQHKVKGKITLNLLKLLGIKFTILKNTNDLKKFNEAIKKSKKDKTIIAGLVEKNILINNDKYNTKKNYYNLDKEIFYFNFLRNINSKDLIISSTGYNSRELFFFRKKYELNKGKDFYMVGGMGHTSSVSLGVNLNRKSNRVICLDGDGSFVMHMGALSTLAKSGNKKLKYILINNNLHDSVGGQTTYVDKINIKKLVLSLGFKKYYLIKNKNNIRKKIKDFLNSKSLGFLEVQTSINKVKNLPRPKKLKDIKNKFLK